MSQSVSVSIIVPVYNVGKYIERCIRSIIAQTYTGSMECIIVDDRGSDDSMERVNRLLDNYDGPIDFKVITHPENKGLSEARNSGIRNAQGEYIYFLDSDDELSIHAMEAFMAKAKENPDAEMIIGEYYLYNDIQDTHTYRNLTNRKDCKIALLAPRYLWHCAHNRLIKKNFVTSNNLFFKSGIFHEDVLWNWCITKHISSLTFLRTGTYIYYMNPESIIHTCVNKRTEDYIFICETMTSSIDPFYKNWQFRSIISYLLDLDSNVRYIYTSEKYDEKIGTIKDIVKKLNRESIKALDLHSMISLLFLNLELRLPISVNNRLYWWLHRAAKMFAVYPRPNL